MSNIISPECGYSPAHQFAVYLADANSSATDTVERFSDDRKILCSKVVTNICSYITFTLGINYYSNDKIEKMKLIFGEKITPSQKQEFLKLIKSHPSEHLSFNQFSEFLYDAKSPVKSLAKDTVDCAFVHLLKKCEQFIEIPK